MNIHEAFIKLKENPKLTVIYKNHRYKKSGKNIYKNIDGVDVDFKIYKEFAHFTIEEILSNDWEVVE